MYINEGFKNLIFELYRIKCKGEGRYSHLIVRELFGFDVFEVFN